MEVAVFGNLGSGKSTLVNGLEQVIPGSTVIGEGEDNPVLKFFMSNPKRYALSLQLMFLTLYNCSWEARARDNSNSLTIIDAGVMTNWHVFTRLQMEMGLITKKQYKDYEGMAKMMMIGTKYPKPEVAVHVTTSPKACLPRIKARGRPFEKKIKISYLEAIDERIKCVVGQYANDGRSVVLVDNEKFDVRKINTVASVAQAILKIQNA